MDKTCPNCKKKLSVINKPTKEIYEKIDLANGIFCKFCGVRLSYTNKKSYLTIVVFILSIPYVSILIWNIYVAQYGKEHFSLEQIDQLWLLISFILFIGIFLYEKRRNRTYILHKKAFENEN
jgi:hypothetical protein